VRVAIHSVGEIVDYVTELIPEDNILLLSIERSQSHLIMTCKYDMTRIEEELGFQTKWTMTQVIRETINLIRRAKGLPEV